MPTLSQSPLAYVRPSAAGGALGGVAYRTREIVLLCEAAGYEVIVVETVGVGQSETEVYQITDFFLLLMLAGAGDELQGIKKGVMELADTLLITKADGDNRIAVQRAQREYQNALHLFRPPDSRVPVKGAHLLGPVSGGNRGGVGGDAKAPAANAGQWVLSAEAGAAKPTVDAPAAAGLPTEPILALILRWYQSVRKWSNG